MRPRLGIALAGVFLTLAPATDPAGATGTRSGPPSTPPPAAAAPRSSNRSATLAEYFRIRRISGASFSFDESLIAYASDEGGRMDIWPTSASGFSRTENELRALEAVDRFLDRHLGS